MAREASGRGSNRMPRERRRFASAEGARSGDYMTRRDIVLVDGLPENGRRRRAVDDPRVYDAPLTPPPAEFGHR